MRDAPGSSTPFRWKNCHADVASSGYGRMALSYVRDVIEPALRALDNEIAALNARPDDPAAVFGIGPVEELRRATLMGFCLSIQAMWENQIRGYLRGCAQELKVGPSAREIATANWSDLDVIFRSVRGVPLSAFNEYGNLTLLHLLGNVCRHGSGPSLIRLASTHTELWPEEQEDLGLELLPALPGPPLEPKRTAENLLISLDLIKTLAAAVDSFWRETEYIYDESIDRKHWSLEKALIEERRKRAGRGRPWDPPA